MAFDLDDDELRATKKLNGVDNNNNNTKKENEVSKKFTGVEEMLKELKK